MPANTTALVSVPGTDPGKVGELGSGRALLAKNAPGVSLVGVQDGAVVFRVGSGDYRFVVGDGLFAATEVPGTVAGTVPATLSLTLGPAASFGAFRAGVAGEYSAIDDGERGQHRRRCRVERERIRATCRTGRSACSSRCGSRSPRRRGRGRSPMRRCRSLFTQAIGINEPLRTGVYSRTVTFTLSTTSP